MSDNEALPVTRQAIAAKDRSLPNRVSGRLKRALDEMAWHGARRAEAAKIADMTDHSLRTALKKPHVIGYLNHQMQVIRESERPRTLLRLTQLRDQDRNLQAAVAASRTLEEMAESQASRSGHGAIAPGLTIVIQNAPGAPPRIVSAPQIEGASAGENVGTKDEPT